MNEYATSTAPVTTQSDPASAEELFVRLSRLAQEVGFEHCAYAIRLPFPVSHRKYLVFQNFDGGSADKCRLYAYASKGVTSFTDDVRRALQSNSSRLQSASGFAFTAPAYHPAGTVGILALKRSDDPSPDHRPPASDQPMAAMARSIHDAMTRALLPRYVPESLAQITRREKEVLRWTADGKTTSEISRIINISERTVKFHLYNAIRKLGAMNKTQAAVKAAALGFLN